MAVYDNNKLGELRPNQIITTFGPGAIVDAVKDYADFMFHPIRKTSPAIILELKKDDTAEKAINQIKEKDYSMKLIKENAERKILAVGICYNSKTKEHECKIEELN